MPDVDELLRIFAVSKLLAECVLVPFKIGTVEKTSLSGIQYLHTIRKKTVMTKCLDV